MKYQRLYAGPDGESHFEQVELELKPGAVQSHLSESIPASEVIFVSAPSEFARDWHHAPRRQFVVTLAGAVEVTASDGERRRFDPGDVLLVEDTTGKGHLTRGAGATPWRCLFVSLVDEQPRAGAGNAPSGEASASYVRIYAGSDGASRFEEVSVPLRSNAGASAQSDPIPATEMFFRRSPASYYYDQHRAPRRQFVITLAGNVEIVAGDGEVCRLGPGSVLLADDTTGEGHISRGAGTAERMTLFVPLCDTGDA